MLQPSSCILFTCAVSGERLGLGAERVLHMSSHLHRPHLGGGGHLREVDLASLGAVAFGFSETASLVGEGQGSGF